MFKFLVNRKLRDFAPLLDRSHFQRVTSDQELAAASEPLARPNDAAATQLLAEQKVRTALRIENFLLGRVDDLMTELASPEATLSPEGQRLVKSARATLLDAATQKLKSRYVQALSELVGTPSLNEAQLVNRIYDEGLISDDDYRRFLKGPLDTALAERTKSGWKNPERLAYGAKSIAVSAAAIPPLALVFFLPEASFLGALGALVLMTKKVPKWNAALGADYGYRQEAKGWNAAQGVETWSEPSLLAGRATQARLLEQLAPGEPFAQRLRRELAVAELMDFSRGVGDAVFEREYGEAAPARTADVVFSDEFNALLDGMRDLVRRADSGELSDAALRREYLLLAQRLVDPKAADAAVREHVTESVNSVVGDYREGRVVAPPKVDEKFAVARAQRFFEVWQHNVPTDLQAGRLPEPTNLRAFPVVPAAGGGYEVRGDFKSTREHGKVTGNILLRVGADGRIDPAKSQVDFGIEYAERVAQAAAQRVVDGLGKRAFVQEGRVQQLLFLKDKPYTVRGEILAEDGTRSSYTVQVTQSGSLGPVSLPGLRFEPVRES